MKAVVVGASGFVGKGVCDALVHRGIEVIEVKAPRLTIDPQLPLQQQVRSLETTLLREELSGADVVINCAGDPGASGSDYRQLLSANAALPRLLARASMESGATRFVHVSSAVVQARASILDDSPATLSNISPYADSKVQGEKLLRDLPTGFVVIYRPPSVHAADRRITRSLTSIARRGLGFVAGAGTRPTPQALLHNVADAVAFLATTHHPLPPIVHHPWEGHTTSSLLHTLSGRRPHHIPEPVARAVIGGGYLASKIYSKLRPNVRRAELMLFGQQQAESWLSAAGWKPPLGLSAWGRLNCSAPVQKRALIVASVASMIDNFNMPNIALLQRMGLGVEVACNFTQGSTTSIERSQWLKSELNSLGVTVHHIDFSREPSAVGKHLRAARQLLRILRPENYVLVHAHSPIGGAIARIISRLRGVPCVYTAHGFHFSRGGPLKNWFLYYPIERLLGPLTHTLVTINSEDHETAQGLGARNVVYTPGVGVQVERFSLGAETRVSMRRTLGVSPDTYCLLSVGELNLNKSHSTVIQSLVHLRDINVHYFICGLGAQGPTLQRMAMELGVSERVTLLGYREDVEALYGAADVFIFPSRREGLGVAVIEAMASGLPVVASNIRGLVDLLIPERGGHLVPPGDPAAFARAVRSIYEDAGAASRMGEFNRRRAKGFSIAAAMQTIEPVYQTLLDERV